MSLMSGVLGLLFVSILGTCAYLQGCESDAFREEAEKNYLRKLRLDTQRGDIFDRNGEALATSVEVETIYANPALVTDPVGVAETLSPILSMEAEALLARLTRGGRFSYIKRQVTAREAAAVRDLDIDGIKILSESKRFYPKKELGGQLLGVVGYDSLGHYGLELTYNDALKGGELEAYYHRDAKGRYAMMEGLPPIETRAGHSLVLTLDEKIQAVAERELERAVLSSLALSGVAVVMDVHTGDVLAMAHYPRFNPNRYRQEIAQDRSRLTAARRLGKRPPSRFLNRAIRDQMEPGSTLKIFTTAAAVEEGLVTLDTMIDTENGRYRVGRKTIHDAHRHNRLSVKEVMKYSSNVGCVKIAEQLGKERLHHYLTEFGFGTRTGVGLSHEASGSLRPYRRWAPITQANIAFGQGIAVTALQLTTAAAAIGNGGVLMKPRVLAAEVDSKGNTIRDFPVERVRRVVSVSTAQDVLEAMETVVDPDGTGHNAWIYDYDVAGKTGTAQKPDLLAGGYAEDRWIASFLGLAPAKRPRIAMLVSIDEPQGQHYGGVVAAPVFKKVASWTLQYLGVAPDYGKRERLNRKRRQTRRQNPPRTAEGAYYDYPTNKRPAYNPFEPLSVEAPDFTGLSVRDAAELAQKNRLMIDISGTGLVSGQAVAVGTPLDPWSRVTVYFGAPESRLRKATKKQRKGAAK